MNRRGMTLVEMLVAMAATLLIMGAVAQVFSAFGSAVSDSRAVIELDSRMRAVAWRLRSDLSGATAPTLPPLRPDQDAGYFEIIEGPNTDRWVYRDYGPDSEGPVEVDKFADSVPEEATSDDRIVGDIDDVLLFTTQSTNPPFFGRFYTGTATAGKIESSVAEVAWFLRPTRSGTAFATSSPSTYTLYRRQLLVAGFVGAEPFASGRNMLDSTTLSGTDTAWRNLMNQYDISVRAASVGGGAMTFFPNTLSDLTRRESRFMHNIAGVPNGTGFPYAFPSPALVLGGTVGNQPDGLTFAGTTREGEDVVLSNVIGFDVRIFDPTALVQVSGSGVSGMVLTPGDQGFTLAGSGTRQGAYVDLGDGNTACGPTFSNAAFARYGARGDFFSRLNASGNSAHRTWDTWSTHFESDGYDQDGAYANPPGIPGIDQGSNGLDDNNDGIVDNGPFDLDANGAILRPGAEAGELETSPPFPYPLRGLEVRLRCYEPSSRQVRQITIRHTFVPH